MVVSKLKTARIARGWTQVQLAVEADLSPRTIENIEHGGIPRMATRKKLLNALGVAFSPAIHVEWFGELPTQGG